MAGADPPQGRWRIDALEVRASGSSHIAVLCGPVCPCEAWLHNGGCGERGLGFPSPCLGDEKK